MLGTVVLLCGLVVFFLWWMVNNYDGESNSSSSKQQQPEHQRRRNRGNKSKKRKQQRGGKDTAAKTPSPPVPSSTGTGNQQRQAPALDVKEWPTLANSSPAQEEEGEEDLAAVHAEMLNAAKSFATEKGGGGKAKAGEGGRDVRKSGRIGVGDRVKGRFEAGAEWFPAVVTKTLHGGLVNLLYDDGERETRVPLSLVRHRAAPEPLCSDSNASSESDGSEEEAEVHGLQVARENRKQADGWEVIVQKPKKTRVERVESRVEANSNLKNRLKRQKKREKELAAREALRKKI